MFPTITDKQSANRAVRDAMADHSSAESKLATRKASTIAARNVHLQAKALAKETADDLDREVAAEAQALDELNQAKQRRAEIEQAALPYLQSGA